MANTFDVEVVAADRSVFRGQAVSMVVPATDGYLGILRGHAPLMAALSIGEIRLTPPGNNPKPVLIAVTGGFVQVLPDRVVVLADSAELADHIDIERARLARQRAEERLHTQVPEVDFDRAQAALLRAINRLRVAGERK